MECLTSILAFFVWIHSVLKVLKQCRAFSSSFSTTYVTIYVILRDLLILALLGAFTCFIVYRVGYCAHTVEACLVTIMQNTFEDWNEFFIRENMYKPTLPGYCRWELDVQMFSRGRNSFFSNDFWNTGECRFFDISFDIVVEMLKIVTLLAHRGSSYHFWSNFVLITFRCC